MDGSRGVGGMRRARNSLSIGGRSRSLHGRTWRCCLGDRCDVETLPGSCPLERAAALILRYGQRDRRCFDKIRHGDVVRSTENRRRSNDELERGDLALVLPNSKLPGVC